MRSHRAHDKYHNLEDDAMVKNIFNSRMHKDGVGMKIPSWMITDEIKLTENYQMYGEEHLIAEEIEKLVEGTENVENVEDDSSTLRQDDTQNIHGTRLEPRSNNESLKKGKGKHVEESRSIASPTTIRSLRTHSSLISSDTKKLQELMVTDPPPSSSTPSSSSLKLKLSTPNQLLPFFKPKPGRFKRYKSFFTELQGRYGYCLNI
nr:hypothetical protein [Tanacetum cinerariifolium]